MIWAGTEASTKRVSDGEVVDIVLIAASNIDKLAAEGRLVAGSRADVAKSGIGVAVRDGLPKPDISSGDAVKKAVLDAKSIAYSSGPSGFYLVELFKKILAIQSCVSGPFMRSVITIERLANARRWAAIASGLRRGRACPGWAKGFRSCWPSTSATSAPVPAPVGNTRRASISNASRLSSSNAGEARQRFRQRHVLAEFGIDAGGDRSGGIEKACALVPRSPAERGPRSLHRR